MTKFLSGAIIGFVAGILLAPDKGINTRENLAGSAARWRERLNRLTGKTATTVDDLRDYLEQDISGLSEDVRNRIFTILDEAEEMAYNPNGSSISNGTA